jgi:hypothetical protein
MARRSSTDLARHRLLAASIAWLAPILATPSVFAQDTDAEALTSQGIALRRVHKNAEAIDIFRRAYALSPSPRIRAHLGLAEQAAGQWIEAERDIGEGLEAHDDPWIAKNRATLEQALGVVVGHLGWIDVRTAVGDTEIWINGTPLPRDARADSIRVVAGTNVVEVRASGYLPAMRTLLVLPNTRMTESFALSPVPKIAVEVPTASDSARHPIPKAETPALPADTAKASDPKDRAQDERSTPWLAYLSWGVGGAGLATGAVTGILSLVRASDAKQYCVGNVCKLQAQDDIDASLTLAKVANAGFIVGGGGLAVGTLVWVLHSRAGTTSQQRPTTNTVSEVRPFVGDRWIGVVGHF